MDTLAVYLCILNSKVFYCSDDLNYITYYYLFIYYYTYLHCLKLCTIETSWALIFIVRAHVVLELYVIRPKLMSLRVVLVLPHHLETLSKIITKICTETTQTLNCFITS